MAKPKPDGYHTITPAITVKGAAAAIEFYTRAFGARERMRMPSPDGAAVMHAELEIGDSVFMLADEFPEMNCVGPQTLRGTTGAMFLYVPDVDAAFRRAVEAGAKVLMPVTDMFWGDRYGQVEDPFGHRWGLATHVEDLSDDEIRRRGAAWAASAAARK
jgi:uncharacterized glyoxalase superfamily protein PhnB